MTVGKVTSVLVKCGDIVNLVGTGLGVDRKAGIAEMGFDFIERLCEQTGV